LKSLNRIEKPVANMNYVEINEDVTQKVKDFYGDLAKSGVDLIIAGSTQIDIHPVFLW
jgi:hypothetical protein